MKFETKFNVDEHSWYMKDNKPTEVVISAIEIFFVNINQDRIKYNAKNVTHSVSWLDHANLMEGVLFKSKNELMNSLFSSDAGCKGKNCMPEMALVIRQNVSKSMCKAAMGHNVSYTPTMSPNP